MLRNMVTSLITHERILTTHTKAKFAQKYADKLCSWGRQDITHNRRMAASYVRGEEAMSKLFTVLGRRYTWRETGFTRVVHVRKRHGDNAPLSYLELVDRPGEIRPSIMCTPQTWMQAQRYQQINDVRQKALKY